MAQCEMHGLCVSCVHHLPIDLLADTCNNHINTIGYVPIVEKHNETTVKLTILKVWMQSWLLLALKHDF